ncbi:MAG TPA: amino acid adenylation domain-containing protein [Methylomirabilota bacterium]|nr:amino acid adenylation domain-containing protein [Methylomirabilota bacterium]
MTASPRSCPGPDGRPTNPFVPFPRAALEGSLTARFAEQVARHPGRLALTMGAERLTYEALDQAANRVAHAVLDRLGGGNEPVVLLLPQSVGQVTAVLGALKAGAIYVPLDPTHPEARLADAIGDAEARLVLTLAAHADLARRAAPRAEVLALDARGALGADTPPTVDVAPDAGAYIFYTSGSTGRPKGVVDTHRNVLHNIMRYTNTLHLCADDRLTLLQGPTFSGAVSSLFGALLNGAAVFPFDVARDGGQRIAEWLAAEAITIYHSVPALFRLAAGSGRPLPALRVVRLEGDRATPSDLALFRERFGPDCVLVNGLGATECGLVRQFFFAAREPVPEGVVPIGAPVEDMEVVLLDEGGRPVAAGETGEIAVRSAYLAMGYWKQPALTAARFVAEPGRPDTRLYRTGDLGRLRADGMLEMLGRRDGHSKVRGQRVEVAEVEAALLALSGVAEAVVLVREDEPGAARLVAYLVPQLTRTLNASELRRALAPRLPDVMVPSALIVLDRLPVDGNGKIDRRALPLPLAGRAESGPTTRLAPRTPRENEIARVWAAVLGVDDVGVEDDFFDLGGNSLLAALVLARVRTAWDVDISLPAFIERPTVAGLAHAIESAPRDVTLRPAVAPIPRLPRSGTGDLFPASFAQERLWFLDQLDPGRSDYNIATGWRITGPLDAGALAHALEWLTERHEILRTSLVGRDGRAWQSVAPRLSVPFEATDLEPLDAAARELEADRLTAEEAHRHFDLEHGPLWRCRLLRFGAEQHVLLATMHHIMSDGWSMDVFARELSAGYRAALAGRRPTAPPLAIQYADYSAWQRERMEGGALEPLLTHWRARLAGAPPSLALATDHPRPARPRGRGRRLPFALSPGVAAALRALARREGATLFMTLLAGFSLLLHRRTAQTDLLIGAPMASRSRPETEGLIGLFLDTLVLRVDCANRPTFRELLARVRATAFDAYAHQELPFEKLVEALRPNRGGPTAPIVTAFINLHNQPASPLRLDRLSLTPMGLFGGGAKFDLNLGLDESAAGISGSLTYDTDLFEPETMTALLAQFASVLEHAAADPDRRLDEISLVPAPERATLVARGRGPHAPAPRAPSVPALVEAQGMRTPEAIAVVQGEASLTYAALVARAQHLARLLRARGAGPGRPVGVCLGRSPDLVAALLGVMRAGAPYVALDPDEPATRLGHILQTVDACCVLTRSDLESRCTSQGHPTLCLDRDAMPGTGDDGASLPRPGLDDLAYVAFTSGSSGVPKGVPIVHRAVLSYLEFLTETFGLRSTDVVLQLARASFDASVREFFAPLAVGARVVLLRDGEAADPEAILERLRAHEATALLALVPSVLRPLTGAAEDRGLAASTLRLVLTTGEPLLYDDVRRAIRHLCPHAAFVNQYGPTECTMTCTFHRVDTAPEAEGAVPIGRPIAGVSALILDAALGPVPAGVPGELYIGGVGVASGYMGDPALSAARFVADPHAAGGRLYKTGDLARARADGTLDFLGRIDRQIKIRGIRTEPGEAESVLRQHPAVREVAVLPWEPHPGDQRLAAYVVAHGAAAVDRAALRQFARQLLPAHLVPAAFVPMSALPLTANRKLDRDALPAPGPDDAVGAPAHVAARTPLEAMLVEIWSDVLGAARIGILDDFFDLGGHSLLAARLVARLRDRLGVEIPLRQIFDNSTIADLALALLEIEASPEGLGGAGERGDRDDEADAPSADEASTLRDLLEAHARHAPTAAAIVAPGRTPLSYRDLLAHVDDTAQRLAGAGLGGRARIAIVAPQGPEAAVAILAVAAAAVCVPLNPAAPPPEIEAILATTPLDALLAPAGAPALGVARRRGLPAIAIQSASAGPAGAIALDLPLPATGAAPAARGHDDIALVLLTSGTTARPKRVPLSHRQILASARGHRQALALRPGDRCLDLMPLFHVNGLMMLIASLGAGSAVVCPPRFEAAHVFAWLDETRPTWVNGTPTVHQGILGQAALERGSAAPIAARVGLRFVRSASSALPPRLREEMERLFAAPVIESYGQTETATLVAVTPLARGAGKTGSAGVSAGPEIAIIDPDGRPLAPGSRGEILVRGVNVMAGYEDDPGTTTASFHDGWYRTGDLGHLDADGFLFITGRLKEIINRGGEKVAPREVEEILLAHPAVREAVTFGVPHRTLGEDVAAAVVLVDGAALMPTDLRRFAAERVSAFKVPRHILLVSEIPRGPAGKPDRAALAHAVAAEVTA